MLAAVHGGIAIALRSPEIALSPEECNEYAGLVAAVARHYDIGASAKALDWWALISYQTSLYGVRALALYARKQGERSGAAAMNGTGAAESAAPAGEMFGGMPIAGKA